MKRQRILIRYTLTGILLTIGGPTVLYILYPLGPLLSYVITDVSIQIARYLLHSRYVFNNVMKYSMDITRYLYVWGLTSLSGYAAYNIARQELSRRDAVIMVGVISAMTGYVWSMLIYSKGRK